jgi:alkylation response protein AidB-like acyl-CoA dehydrogenase
MTPTPLLDELSQWLHEHWDPDRTLRTWWADLAESGWSQPQWPVEWYGRACSRDDAIAVARAIRDFGALNAPAGFATGMAAPTLIEHGTDEQKARHLPGIVTGIDAFCQLFSEPNAGSDLAGLQCRAERDGNEWVVNGQKVWTSAGRIANKAMLVARTNVDVPKHAGISYFFIDVTQPGVEMRPLREMTGRAFFNEVFLTNARVPVDDLIGGEGNGWAVANTTLAFERALSGGTGAGPTPDAGGIAGNLDAPVGTFVGQPQGDELPSSTGAALQLAATARRLGRAGDPRVRADLVRLYVLERVIALTTDRGLALQRAGRDLPGLPNLAKMQQSHAIRLERDLTFEILQATGMLHAYDAEAAVELEREAGIKGLGHLVDTALFAQAPPIYAGSDQIQRNIVGERVLGLPREPNPQRDTPFRDLPKN